MSAPYRGIAPKPRRQRDEKGMFEGDHRCTPPVLWRAALHAIGAGIFDLDAATNAHATVPALQKFDNSSPALDGLIQPWRGNVWLNFPFSRPKPWVEKVAGEAHRCRSITVLGPHDVSTDWNQHLVRVVDAFATWPRREHFSLPTDGDDDRLPNGRKKTRSPPGAIALFYVGPQSNAWQRIMRDCYGCTVYDGVTTGDRSLVLYPPKKPRTLEEL